MSDVLKALHRLKARLGREQARARRMYKNGQSERSYVEHYSIGIAMGFVDAEIRRAKEKP